MTLVKGKVAVTLDQKKTISLSPGEKIDYNLATSLYNVNKTNTYKWCSWKDGILIFRDDPLEYVFKRLGQYQSRDFYMNKENNDIALFKKTISSMVIRKISYYRVIVSLCLFMFLLSPVFGDENSAVSFDKELSENNIVTIQPDSLRILHNPLTGWVLYASMGVDAADFWEQYDHMSTRFSS